MRDTPKPEPFLMPPTPPRCWVHVVNLVQDEEGGGAPCNVVLETMRKTVAKWQSGRSIHELAGKLQVHYSTALRYLQSTAEASRQGQTINLEEICNYVHAMQNVMHPLVLVFHQMHDETALHLRVSFHEADGADNQIAKTFVILSRWSMVLQLKRGIGYDSSSPDAPANFILLQGCWAPRLAAANATTARAIAAILDKAPRPPKIALDTFETVIRMAETDEAPANLKAERMFQQHFASHSAKVVAGLHWCCSAHKGHAVAEKTFLLFAETLSSIVSTLLVVQTSQQLARVRAALRSVVRTKLRVMDCQPLSTGAQQYRRQTLNLYMPADQYCKKKKCSDNVSHCSKW